MIPMLYLILKRQDFSPEKNKIIEGNRCGKSLGLEGKIVDRYSTFSKPTGSDPLQNRRTDIYKG